MIKMEAPAFAGASILNFIYSPTSPPGRSSPPARSLHAGRYPYNNYGSNCNYLDTGRKISSLAKMKVELTLGLGNLAFSGRRTSNTSFLWYCRLRPTL
jgi:hypothetical protein